MNNIMGTFYLALYIFLFIKLCFSFVFSLSTYPLCCWFYFHMSCYWFALGNPVMGMTRLRYLHSAWGPVISLLFVDPLYQMAAPWNSWC
jgi:hypothetical protein